MGMPAVAGRKRRLLDSPQWSSYIHADFGRCPDTQKDIQFD